MVRMAPQMRETVEQARLAARERLFAEATTDEQRAMVDENTRNTSAWLRYTAASYVAILERSREAAVTARAAILAVAGRMAAAEGLEFDDLDADRQKGYIALAGLEVSELAQRIEAAGAKVPA